MSKLDTGLQIHNIHSITPAGQERGQGYRMENRWKQNDGNKIRGEKLPGRDANNSQKERDWRRGCVRVQLYSYYLPEKEDKKNTTYF